MLKNIPLKKPRYHLSQQGEFIIENYNTTKPFANFFPGIAGKYGIPMWVFYVNRGQGIASFGTRDKDRSILEFFPANKSWQLTSLRGFRTFIKIASSQGAIFYEPFHNGFVNSGFNLNSRMRITAYDLKLEEENLSLGLKTTVEYFTIPNDHYAALARIVTLKNLGPKNKKLQIIDGLPQIVPFGTSNLFLKKLGRTLEAWTNVENLKSKVPFYKLAVDPTDRPEVIHIKEGNFYLGFYFQGGKPVILEPIINPKEIFGPITDFSYPIQFLAKNNFKVPKEQTSENTTPCGFLSLNIELPAKAERTFCSLVGYMRNAQILNKSLKRITHAEYLNTKKAENKSIIEGLQQDINMVSNSRELDLYAKQTYLDNIVRGGYPVILSRGIPFYLYSRKHGDLERDYNKFQIQPTYFSQGNGNYRDMNQNRRCDIWFNPEVKEENLVSFFNLLQTDGFNPLVVKGMSFSLKKNADLKKACSGLLEEKDINRLISFLDKPTPQTEAHTSVDKQRLSGFTPGEIILFLQDNKIPLKTGYDEFLQIILSCCEANREAEHGEGFWTDHWTYNLDLLENYLGVYPERLKEIIFEEKVFTFYDNTEVVKPRSDKYILKGNLVRQLHAIAPDNAKKEMIKKRALYPHLVRAKYGKGEIYRTNLLNKLLCLLANKLSALDPFGIGIEMEADKPNWYDALNGLPALFGSSISETLELKRLILLIKEALESSAIEKVYITEEVHRFLVTLSNLIKEYFNNNSGERDYQYWDKSNALKEEYRSKTRFGLSGDELEMTASDLIAILNNGLRKVDLGINKAREKKNNLYCTYFINEVAEFEVIKEHFIKPKRFRQIKLPLFLEGQMHALKINKNIQEARRLYKAVKASSLFDNKLQMYKVTVSLKNMPEEIGRCRVFTPGWLEHESIWLHMEYKYLLEILRGGLYEEFFADFKNVLIPFQNPLRYGRNILENSSFIVSSAFADKELHGNGFIARLSGSTAEFLQIWLVMNLGPKPFIIDKNGRLNLCFHPLLPGWLFRKKEGTYTFNFLSRIRVVYHNPKRKNTFGRNAAVPKKIAFRDKDANPIEIPSDTIPAPYAEQVRGRLISQIDVYLS